MLLPDGMGIVLGSTSERLEEICRTVISRNPGEMEFHQAVREVLESLGPVLAKRPELAEQRVIERIC